MKKGKFIVIEGVDGAGKGTQIELLKKYLKYKNQIDNFVFVKEPGGTNQGEEIRKTILKYNLNSITEILLFYASRNELIKDVIEPAIKQGKNVISDRYELSTFAYQIYGRENNSNRKLIEFLQKEISIIPDKYYFFDLNVEIAKKRANKRDEDNTRFDDEGKQFFNRVRKGYKRELLKYNHKIIDASRGIDDVFDDFIDDFKKEFENKKFYRG